MRRCAKLTWMKKPIVFIYTFSNEVDLTARALIKAGYRVALPYDCEWAGADIIKIPKSEIDERGVIRGGLHYLDGSYDSPDVILAEEYVTAEDILLVEDKMLQEPDSLVLAERENPSGDGRFEKIAYSIIRGLFTVVQGKAVHDMHSGVRGIPGQYLSVFCDMKGTDRDFLMGQIMALRRLNINLVRCKAITQGTSSAAHSLRELLRDVLRVAMLFIKFVSSSLLATLVDNLALYLMLKFVTDTLVIASSTGRIISSIVNFIINHSVVFKGEGRQNIKKMFFKYYLLVFPLWGIHFFGLSLFVNVVGLSPVVSNIIVGTIVYAMSFLFQRDFVFKSKKHKQVTQ